MLPVLSLYVISSLRGGDCLTNVAIIITIIMLCIIDECRGDFPMCDEFTVLTLEEICISLSFEAIY